MRIESDDFLPGRRHGLLFESRTFFFSWNPFDLLLLFRIVSGRFLIYLFRNLRFKRKKGHSTLLSELLCIRNTIFCSKMLSFAVFPRYLYILSTRNLSEIWILYFFIIFYPFFLSHMEIIIWIWMNAVWDSVLIHLQPFYSVRLIFFLFFFRDFCLNF